MQSSWDEPEYAKLLGKARAGLSQPVLARPSARSRRRAARGRGIRGDIILGRAGAGQSRGWVESNVREDIGQGCNGDCTHDRSCHSIPRQSVSLTVREADGKMQFPWAQALERKQVPRVKQLGPPEAVQLNAGDQGRQPAMGTTMCPTLRSGQVHHAIPLGKPGLLGLANAALTTPYLIRQVTINKFE